VHLQFRRYVNGVSGHIIPARDDAKALVEIKGESIWPAALNSKARH